jgi:hypothetical protein
MVRRYRGIFLDWAGLGWIGMDWDGMGIMLYRLYCVYDINNHSKVVGLAVINMNMLLVPLLTLLELLYIPQRSSPVAVDSMLMLT